MLKYLRTDSMLTDLSFIIALYVATRLLSMIFSSGPNEEPAIVRRIVAPLAFLLVLAFSVSIAINANKMIEDEQKAKQLLGVPE